MVKESQQRTVKVICSACNGSLNSYDFYSCPVCQGSGFVKPQIVEEAPFPEAMAKDDGFETFAWKVCNFIRKII
jgi:DnaJ-class molecular chaperone